MNGDRIASDAATISLLWEAGRLDTRVDAVRTWSELADPDLLIRLAFQHGLGAMLWRALRTAGCGDSLGAAAAPLAEHADLLRLEQVLLLPHAVKVAVQPLLDAGLEPIVFKGPALATRYPEAGLRPMLDLDVIVPRAHHRIAVESARAAGWNVTINADRNHYETVLAHPEVPTLLLELHRGLDTWFQRSARIDLDDLWSRRVGIDCFATTAFGLPVEVELVALAAHAGKPFHTFSRLIWAVDLTVVAKKPVDWDAVGALATSWHCRTMLAAALRQSRHFGLDCPTDLTTIRASNLRRRVIDPVGTRSWPLQSASIAAHKQLRYALADRWTRRLVLFAGLAAPAPVHTWPQRYIEDLLRAGRRAWNLWRGRAA